MTTGQKTVYTILKKYGPLADHALVPIVQHEAGVHISSSGVRTRRSELVDLKKVREVSTIKMPSGRNAAVWATK